MKCLFLLSFLLFLLTACASTPSGPQTLTVMTHDSFAVSQSVVQSFEKANNAKVSFLQSGDAGAALNKAILTKDAPLADVFFGVDNTFLSRALEGNIYEAYQSPALANVSAKFDLDPSHRVIPIDYGDVCINYDKAYFSKNNLTAPQTLEDLAKPEYKGLLVVENPATSSTGLAFLLATHVHFGNDYLKYWKTLKDNGVVVVDGWETAYYTNFSGSSGHGPQPMVLSYASSPAAEVTPKGAPTASILGPDTCFRQIEFVGILRGTHQRVLAEKFVDFMLSKQFQEDMPLQMYVYPVNKDAVLPESFTLYAQTPSQPAALTPDEIAANRDKWIQEWIATVLK
jgi:thiamine transport system substrate-binding protein